MKSIEQISNEFLSECHDDYVGLWSLIWTIENKVGETNPQRARALTISLITDLLKEGLIKAGMPNANGEFEEWPGTPGELVKRIEREWDQLGREPNIGEIVWFTASGKGDTDGEEGTSPASEPAHS
jgi:hypothetical protein